MPDALVWSSGDPVPRRSAILDCEGDYGPTAPELADFERPPEQLAGIAEPVILIANATNSAPKSPTDWTSSGVERHTRLASQ
jgi:hypothetical protein